MWRLSYAVAMVQKHKLDLSHLIISHFVTWIGEQRWLQFKYSSRMDEINKNIRLERWIEYMRDVLLCLRKSWSDGPIWGWAAVSELPSRGSSWSQGGTAPATHIDQIFYWEPKGWEQAAVKSINPILAHVLCTFIHRCTCMHIPTVCRVLWIKIKHLWVQGDNSRESKMKTVSMTAICPPDNRWTSGLVQLLPTAFLGLNGGRRLPKAAHVLEVWTESYSWERERERERDKQACWKKKPNDKLVMLQV